MISRAASVLLLLQCVMLAAAEPCDTPGPCQCEVRKLDNANGYVSKVIPWPHNECNMCHLTDTSLVCARETAMDTRTFQYGFWAPHDARINANTVAVIKVKKAGHDVVHKHLIIRGFDTPEMQGCGRGRFPDAGASSANMTAWASDTATTTWSWGTTYQYEPLTSCAAEDKIWFYNVHVLASEEEIASGAQLVFEFHIDDAKHIATQTQTLREGTRGVDQIYEIGDFPKVLTLMPVLFRLVCSVNETSCPDEWNWHTAAVFSSTEENTMTSVVDRTQVTASADCDTRFDSSVEIGESFSFSAEGSGCTVSILKIVEPCESGKTFLDRVCTDCLPGTYKSSPGSQSCSTCAPNMVSGSAQTMCQDCEDYGSANADNTLCICKPGAFFSDGAQICTACAKGTSKAEADRRTSCWPCRVGKYSDATGASVCKDCQDNANTNGDRSGCICNTGYTAVVNFQQQEECFETDHTDNTQAVQERVSVPPGTNWVTFSHFNPGADSAVLTIMNTAVPNAWKPGDVVTVIRDGIPAQTVSYTRHSDSWGDIASFMNEMHLRSNVYVVQTSSGVDLTNTAPVMLEKDLPLRFGKTYMAWHRFPENVPIHKILSKTPNFDAGDRLQVKLPASASFSVVFSKLGTTPGAWSNQAILNELQHVRGNVYAFQMFGSIQKHLRFPSDLQTNSRAALLPSTNSRLLGPVGHSLGHHTDNPTPRRRLLMESYASELPARTDYTNPSTCTTTPECRCKSDTTRVDISWPGQVCNKCVMAGLSLDNCVGNDAYSHQRVQIGFFLNTTGLPGVDVSVNTMAVAKLKKTTANGAPFPEMSIRQWGHPLCVGCRTTGASIVWLSLAQPTACDACQEDGRIFFFRLALLTLDSEIRKIDEISSKTALLVNFEFDIRNAIYVTESTASLSEHYSSASTSHVSTSYGETHASQLWPNEYVIHKKLFEIDCVGDPMDVFVSDPCPYEGRDDFVMKLAPDITGAQAKGEILLVQKPGVRKFKWTIRQVYELFALEVHVELQPFYLQDCTASGVYATWTEGNTVYSCDPQCKPEGEPDGCDGAIIGDYNDMLNIDCSKDDKRWASPDMQQSDSLTIKKFSGDNNAFAYEIVSCSTAGAQCLTAAQKWTLSSQFDRLEIEYVIDGFECNGVPNNIQIRINTSISDTPMNTVQCENGHTMHQATGLCRPCSAGKYKPSYGNTPCLLCPVHSTSVAGTVAVTGCTCGTGYSGQNGGPCTETLEECAAGRTPSSTGACADCEAGTYKAAAGRGSCTLCPEDEVSLPKSTASTACRCDAGTTRAAGGGCVVFLCETLSTTPTPDSTTCLCMPGAEKKTANAVCTECGRSTYKVDLSDTSKCVPCPDNEQTVYKGAATAESCICNAGYTRNSAMQCQGCEAGTFKTVAGNHVCEGCAVGTFSTLTAQISDTTCGQCPPLASSSAGSAACVCKPGADKKTTGADAQCTLCLRDTYKQGLDDSACQPCHANAKTENEGATSSDACECQAALGWLRKPGDIASAASCEQLVVEMGGVFELAVALSDFANDVGKVQTNFTNALGTVFGADPADVTLVYYETHAAGSALGQRRLLQQQSPTPATTVEATVRVFASIYRGPASAVSAHLLALVPGIKILQMRTVPENYAPTAPTAPPGSSPVVMAKNDTAAGTDFVLYAAGGGAALLLILICVVVLVVVLQPRSSHNGHIDDGVGDDVGQNMESTDFRPYNTRCPMLGAQCGGARGVYLYHDHAYNALNTGGHPMP